MNFKNSLFRDIAFECLVRVLMPLRCFISVYSYVFLCILGRKWPYDGIIGRIDEIQTSNQGNHSDFAKMQSAELCFSKESQVHQCLDKHSLDNRFPPPPSSCMRALIGCTVWRSFQLKVARNLRQILAQMLN